jgi:hypothetical protein
MTISARQLNLTSLPYVWAYNPTAPAYAPVRSTQVNSRQSG